MGTASGGSLAHSFLTVRCVVLSLRGLPHEIPSRLRAVTTRRPEKQTLQLTIPPNRLFTPAEYLFWDLEYEVIQS